MGVKEEASHSGKIKIRKSIRFRPDSSVGRILQENVGNFAIFKYLQN